MAQGHALRPSGGPARVDDIKEVRARWHRAGRPDWTASAARSPASRSSVTVPAGRQEPARLRVGHKDPRAGVGQHVGQALGRVAGIERQVAGARLQDAEDAHGEVDRAIEAKPDDCIRAGAQALKAPGQSVRPGVQFRIGQPLRAVRHRQAARDRARPAPPPAGGQAARRRSSRAGVVKGAKDPPALPCPQHGEVEERPVRGRGACRREMAEVLAMRAAVSCGKQPGTIFQPAFERRAPFAATAVKVRSNFAAGTSVSRYRLRAHEIPSAGGSGRGSPAGRTSRRTTGCDRVRAAAAAPRRGARRGRPGARRRPGQAARTVTQPIPERRLACDGRAHDKGVRKEADQRGGLRPAAAGHRRADGNVALARVPVEPAPHERPRGAP